MQLPTFARRTVAVLVSLALAAGAFVGTSATRAVASTDKYLYWAPESGIANSIGRVGIDGSDHDPNFIQNLDAPVGLATNSSRIFWGNNVDIDGTQELSVGSASVNGTNVNKNFLPRSDFAYSYAANETHIYWTSMTEAGGVAVARANANGSGTPNEQFIDPEIDPGPDKTIEGQMILGVTIDSEYIYWNYAVSTKDSNDDIDTEGYIGRAKLDGTEVDRTFIDDVFMSYDLAVSGGYLFWQQTADASSEIYIARSKVDGTEIDREFIQVPGVTPGIVADDTSIYWVLNSDVDGGGDPIPNSGKITRANLDGTNIVDLVTGMDSPFSLAISSDFDPNPPGPNPPGPTPPSPKDPVTKKSQQFRKGTPPKRIKARGTTVLNKARATTRERQPQTAKVRVTSPRGEVRCFRVRTSKNRKVTIRTYGRCSFTVRVTYTAPGNSKFKAFKKTKVYRVKR